MEDLLKFLLVAGVIIIGFVKQAKKEARHQTVSPEDEDDMPHTRPTHPLPESWEGIPIPPVQPEERQPKNKKRKQATKPFIPKNHETQPNAPRTQPTIQTPQTNNRPETEDASPDIDIQSIEEIRRGIIWSEILQRKY